MSEAISGSIEQASDLGTNDAAKARRWKLELKLADKREEAWRKKVESIYDIYAPTTPVNNSFNILWSNTETLRHAVYNSLPQPRCRRRYSDEDPLGLQCGLVLTRALEFSQDTYDLHEVFQGVTLGMLLSGRAVSRIRYIPTINKMIPSSVNEDENSMVDGETGEDMDEEESESYEEIGWEQVICERVNYEDFRILCAAQKWEDVSAIGFKHRLTRDDLIDKFGEEVGNKISLDDVADSDIKGSSEHDLFKTAEVWEIWDKDEKEVVWICSGYPVPCKVQNDPLGLQGFFPVPRPIYAVENDKSLVPTPLYTQYEQQAKELNRVSTRINKLVDGLRLRGVYDATLTELSELMKSGDNDLVPSMGVTALIERGGLEKAIWMMPIEQAAMVIKELYAQRDQTKQVIYELTGISDIMRAASDPSETFGAQKIKAQWGTQRLQRMQLEMQRYIRDVIRMKAEIISEKFQIETLEQMTLVKLPHRAEVEQKMQQMMAQYQQQAQMAMMQGQQPPPLPQMPPPPVTWEDVKEEISNDATRTYHIDIETDSTLSATQESDMQGLREVLTGMAELINGFGGAVQAGAIPVEAVKAVMGVLVRRAKMGTEVELAMDKIKAPNPQADPEQVKAQAAEKQQQAQMQHDMQIAQMKAQVEQAKEQAQAQGDQAKEQARMQAEMQIEQARMQANAQTEQMKTEMTMRLEEQKMQAQYALAEAERQHKLQVAQMQNDHAGFASQAELDYNRWKAELESNTRIMVAEIAAKASLESASMSKQGSEKEGLAESAEPTEPKEDKTGQAVERLAGMHLETIKALNGVVSQLNKPRKIKRDANGRAEGIE